MKSCYTSLCQMRQKPQSSLKNKSKTNCASNPQKTTTTKKTFELRKVIRFNPIVLQHQVFMFRWKMVVHNISTVYDPPAAQTIACSNCMAACYCIVFTKFYHVGALESLTYNGLSAAAPI